MTDDDYKRLGKACKEAVDGNLYVGSFVAEMVGESYPFSKDMCAILFKPYSDLELGKKFVEWTKKVGA